MRKRQKLPILRHRPLLYWIETLKSVNTNSTTRHTNKLTYIYVYKFFLNNNNFSTI